MIGQAVDVNTLRVLASTRRVREVVAGRWEAHPVDPEHPRRRPHGAADPGALQARPGEDLGEAGYPSEVCRGGRVRGA